mmetsp:Transcript_16676/g.40015  ORF Transcript_16676/g.40015 Transcript_16676/m.40015 type:complete len:145 (-) Transcript_16676:615-1049(-)
MSMVPTTPAFLAGRLGFICNACVCTSRHVCPSVDRSFGRLFSQSVSRLRVRMCVAEFSGWAWCREAVIPGVGTLTGSLSHSLTPLFLATYKRTHPPSTRFMHWIPYLLLRERKSVCAYWLLLLLLLFAACCVRRSVFYEASFPV